MSGVSASLVIGEGMGTAYWRFWTRMKESTIGAVEARRARGDGLGNLVEVCAGDNAVFGHNGVIGLGAKPRRQPLRRH